MYNRYHPDRCNATLTFLTMEPNRHFNFDQEKASDRIKPKMPSKLRLAFAIFICVVFIFVGLTFLFNWFNVIYDPRWEIFRWIAGPAFILYGIFRAYRYYNPQKFE